ncbi:hypothetical protein THAOC_09043 [Thalassiosira oceanica]|uniref:Uncharacterized protein n=1 Tax=Thalassiosira oceanica TaxID=159749 RepID=K0SXL5_THAOC|nr:hypothetical protein THAOC_09043 [Thalassiosira oceanica]|eukprot:EJK69674.1 hypothetical protein THAOC_09043 [Thalassiosira oceanica]
MRSSAPTHPPLSHESRLRPSPPEGQTRRGQQSKPGGGAAKSAGGEGRRGKEVSGYPLLPRQQSECGARVAPSAGGMRQEDDEDDGTNEYQSNHVTSKGTPWALRGCPRRAALTWGSLVDYPAKFLTVTLRGGASARNGGHGGRPGTEERDKAVPKYRSELNLENFGSFGRELRKTSRVEFLLRNLEPDASGGSNNARPSSITDRQRSSSS